MSRAELQSQLQSVNQMKAGVFQQMMLTEQGPARAELQTRLNALNTRTGRLEAQLLSADDAIAAALAQGVAGSADVATTPAPPPPPAVPGIPAPGTQDPVIEIPDHVFHDVINPMEEAVAAGAFAVVLSFIVISTFFYRMARRRTKQLFESLMADQARRFEQLQQAIDVVAVETERISEAQRFVSRRVNELGAGDAQPIGTARPVGDPLRRDQR